MRLARYNPESIEPLLEFKPLFIDVTYHRGKYVFRQRPGGLLAKKTVRKRPGTVGICAAIKNRFDVDTVPHLICGGFLRKETENPLIDLNFLGIDNVLALRGDPIKTESHFTPHPDFTPHPEELAEAVARCRDNEAARAVGIGWCLGQSHELLAHGVACLHLLFDGQGRKHPARGRRGCFERPGPEFRRRRRAAGPRTGFQFRSYQHG